jgi:hypothetical protein
MAGTKFELRSRGVDDSKTQIWRIPFVLAQERCEDGEEKESGNVLIASGREETRASGAVFQEALILIKSKCLGRNQARAQSRAPLRLAENSGRIRPRSPAVAISICQFLQ